LQIRLNGYFFLVIITLFRFSVLGFYHTDDANDDKGNRKNLSHIDRQGFLETLLYLFGILDEEAESEDVRQAEAKVPASANLLRHPFV